MLTFNGQQIKLNKYPAGELIPPNDLNIRASNELVIRGVDVEDFLSAAIIARLCRRTTYHGVRLYVPYLPAARGDKDGSCRFYRDLLSSIETDEKICFDPHSLVMPSMLGGLCCVSPTSAIQKIFAGRIDGVIAPDLGAIERASKAAEALDVPLYQAQKVREPSTGKLSGFSCEKLPASGRMLVVDDICDGGGTFMGLAPATGLPRERLALWVSHGVFSGRAADLTNFYGEIVTTDSFPSLTDVNCRRVPVLDYMR